MIFESCADRQVSKGQIEGTLITVTKVHQLQYTLD